MGKNLSNANANEMVSIYIPTKNRKAALEKAINSVLNQTYVNIELIVVNDGSADGTAEFLEKKAKIDSRLIYFNKPISEGAPAARNLAIRKATGCFVTGLDDDDEFLPDRIRAFVEFWSLLTDFGYKPACIYSQDIIVKNGLKIGNTKKRGLVNFNDLFEHNFIGNQVFAPRSHFVQAGLFNEELPAWQDMEMFMRILKMFGTAHLLDYQLQLYDDTPKIDRISIKGGARIRKAYKRIADLHASNSDRDAQMLFFQMFSRFYGLRPGLSDWITFMKLDFWPLGFLKLIFLTFRP